MSKKNRSTLIFVGIIAFVLVGLGVAGSRGGKTPDCNSPGCHSGIPAGTKLPPNHRPIDRR